MLRALNPSHRICSERKGVKWSQLFAGRKGEEDQPTHFGGVKDVGPDCVPVVLPLPLCPALAVLQSHLFPQRRLAAPSRTFVPEKEADQLPVGGVE